MKIWFWYYKCRRYILAGQRMDPSCIWYCCRRVCHASQYLQGQEYCLLTISLLESCSLNWWYKFISISSTGESSDGNQSTNSSLASLWLCIASSLRYEAVPCRSMLMFCMSITHSQNVCSLYLVGYTSPLNVLSQSDGSCTWHNSAIYLEKLMLLICSWLAIYQLWMCRSCIPHAILPTFSLSGTSLNWK